MPLYRAVKKGQLRKGLKITHVGDIVTIADGDPVPSWVEPLTQEEINAMQAERRREEADLDPLDAEQKTNYERSMEALSRTETGPAFEHMKPQAGQVPPEAEDNNPLGVTDDESGQEQNQQGEQNSPAE